MHIKNFVQVNSDFPASGIVACSGLEGSNAQAACMKLLPEGNIMYVNSFNEVFEAVASEKCTYGVLPIENSFNGSVRAVYELMIKHKFFIAKSLLLPIRHNLLAKHGVSIQDITEIYSHSQALGQCSRFLSGLDAKSIPFWNTAGAAKMVSDSEDLHIAAIASPLCEKLYGLNSLAVDIQDDNNNYTKFICISREPVIYSGADHMSLIIGCENVPGALNAVLSKISAHNVNMNKLESCPKQGRKFEYIFFLELEASVNDTGIIPMLDEIEASCPEFMLLGNYELI